MSSKNKNKIKAKKSFGQNFLNSTQILSTIAESGHLDSSSLVLEVGPGKGALTEEILKRASRVIAIEKDERLIPILEEKFKNEIKSGKLDLVLDDILNFNTEVLKFYRLPYKIIANIPYYITGQILRKFLEGKNKPETMVVMVQKEVAERIVAKDKKESLLSLSVKAFGTPKIVKVVKRGAFKPQPRVDSAILSITDISDEKLKGLEQNKFFRLLHIGFSHKRKQLASNLAKDYRKEKVLASFNALGIKNEARAEDLKLDKWIMLSKLLHV